jgi:hypothetical protein
MNHKNIAEVMKGVAMRREVHQGRMKEMFDSVEARSGKRMRNAMELLGALYENLAVASVILGSSGVPSLIHRDLEDQFTEIQAALAVHMIRDEAKSDEAGKRELDAFAAIATQVLASVTDLQNAASSVRDAMGGK